MMRMLYQTNPHRRCFQHRDQLFEQGGFSRSAIAPMAAGGNERFISLARVLAANSGSLPAYSDYEMPLVAR